MDRCNFTNASLREPRHGTDHKIILAVLGGEGGYVAVVTYGGIHDAQLK